MFDTNLFGEMDPTRGNVLGSCVNTVVIWGRGGNVHSLCQWVQCKKANNHTNKRFFFPVNF